MAHIWTGARGGACPGFVVSGRSESCVAGNHAAEFLGDTVKRFSFFGAPPDNSFNPIALSLRCVAVDTPPLP